jgi:D-alanine-D-alanine ligase
MRALFVYSSIPHMGKKIRVGVVFGGRSAEHEVSIQSARNILEAIDRSKYDVILLGIDREGRWYLNDRSLPLLEKGKESGILPDCKSKGAHEVALAPRGDSTQLLDLSSNKGMGTLDVVFPILHGPYGEDGSVQGLCKLANMPCVGAGILGSSVGMDKEVMKRLLRDAGIPIARFVTLKKSAPDAVSFEAAEAELGAPLFVKPANLGSSVGVSKVRTAEEYRSAVSMAFRYDTKILVEECINGREVECAVLGNENPQASIPGEIKPAHDFYDYDAKYIDENGAALEIPARLDAKTTEGVRELALKTFLVLCCEGMARVDMFVEEGGRILVNEINTIPGFTRISMYPKLWEASGIPYAELIDRLIRLALERFADEQKLESTPR